MINLKALGYLHQTWKETKFLFIYIPKPTPLFLNFILEVTKFIFISHPMFDFAAPIGSFPFVPPPHQLSGSILFAPPRRTCHIFTMILCELTRAVIGGCMTYWGGGGGGGGGGTNGKHPSYIMYSLGFPVSNHTINILFHNVPSKMAQMW